MLVFAAALTVASVVRLALFARREEIHIMQLVGAPIAYIKRAVRRRGADPGGRRRGRRARRAVDHILAVRKPRGRMARRARSIRRRWCFCRSPTAAALLAAGMARRLARRLHCRARHARGRRLRRPVYAEIR